MTGLASLETQAGEAATQQQKSLITALALKRQEDALLKLQAQQAALLAQHEKQLGALVQRQIQRQQQMVRQQEQIQAHIQVKLCTMFCDLSFSQGISRKYVFDFRLS